MSKKLLIKNIGELATPLGNKPKKGTEMSEIKYLKNAWILVEDDTIKEVGEGEFPSSYVDEDTEVLDAGGKLVTPGFVDSHTHLVHYGSRENELALKLKGVPYLEILKMGGGILNTVRKTRTASFEELKNQSLKSLEIMLQHGTTTVESKSGYGLDVENEIKQLEVMKVLNEIQPVDVVPTFMGAHAVPEEYKKDKRGYIDLIINKMLPIVREKNLAEFCDVFCEEGVFSVEESREILSRAKEYGFDVKIHADEIYSIGGAELAAELSAISAEHLLAASDEGLKKMVEKEVIAVLLPGTSFNLATGKHARARDMINMGLAVALATDYNPGSCPTESMQLMMSLGCINLRMTPEEVLTAVTLNGACALNRGDLIGTIERGKKADIVIFDAPNLYYIMYHFGINHVDKVIKNGKVVVNRNNWG